MAKKIIKKKIVKKITKNKIVKNVIKKTVKKSAGKIVKKPIKKPAKKKTSKKPTKKIIKKIKPRLLTAKPKKEKIVGKVTHYFSNIKVAVIKAKDAIKIGDEIHIRGGEVDFKQTVSSMQINHQSVKSAKKGQEFGIKVKKKIREGYLAYK